jgi:5-methylcytosine-specific restriction endonuclease McrA
MSEFKICPRCNKKFTKKDIKQNVPQHLVERSWKTRRFCSLSCCDKYHVSKSNNKLFDELGYDSCQICDYDEYPILEIHHITQKAHGGTNGFNNLIVLCPNCHIMVHKKYITMEVKNEQNR